MKAFIQHIKMKYVDLIALILTMPYPIMPVGVVAGKAMTDGG